MKLGCKLLTTSFNLRAYTYNIALILKTRKGMEVLYYNFQYAVEKPLSYDEHQ